MSASSSTTKPPPVHWTVEEYKELFKFLQVNAKSELTMQQLAKRFFDGITTESKLTVDLIYSRIKIIKNKIKKDAPIEWITPVERRQITEAVTFGSVETNKTQKEKENLLELLMEKTRNDCQPIMYLPLLWAEYRKRFGNLKETELNSRFKYITENIFKSEFDKETQIKLLFITRAKISSTKLEELEKEAKVKLDDQALIHYVAKDGSLDLRVDKDKRNIQLAKIRRLKKQEAESSDLDRNRPPPKRPTVKKEPSSSGTVRNQSPAARRMHSSTYSNSPQGPPLPNSARIRNQVLDAPSTSTKLGRNQMEKRAAKTSRKTKRDLEPSDDDSEEEENTDSRDQGPAPKRKYRRRSPVRDDPSDRSRSPSLHFDNMAPTSSARNVNLNARRAPRTPPRAASRTPVQRPIAGATGPDQRPEARTPPAFIEREIKRENEEEIILEDPPAPNSKFFFQCLKGLVATIKSESLGKLLNEIDCVIRRCEMNGDPVILIKDVVPAVDMAINNIIRLSIPETQTEKGVDYRAVTPFLALFQLSLTTLDSFYFGTVIEKLGEEMDKLTGKKQEMWCPIDKICNAFQNIVDTAAPGAN